VAPVDEREAFITAIAVELQLRAYPPLERIMSPGVTVNEMFIINRGIVSIHMTLQPDPDAKEADTFGHLHVQRSIPTRAYQALRQGNCFGHEIVFGGHKSVYYATTLTYCDISVLAQDKLEEILESQSLLGTQVNLRAHVARNEWSSLRNIKREDSFKQRKSERAKELASEIVDMRKELDRIVTELQEREDALELEEGDGDDTHNIGLSHRVVEVGGPKGAKIGPYAGGLNGGRPGMVEMESLQEQQDSLVSKRRTSTESGGGDSEV
jgi:hypothetical protein